MEPGSRQIAEWEQTIGQIQKGIARTEAEQILGAPSKTVFRGEFDIIAYRAEQTGGHIYSIRVAYEADHVSQCYLGIEACEGDARGKPQKRRERLQLVLVVLIAAVVFALFYVFKTR